MTMPERVIRKIKFRGTSEELAGLHRILTEHGVDSEVAEFSGTPEELAGLQRILAEYGIDSEVAEER